MPDGMPKGNLAVAYGVKRKNRSSKPNCPACMDAGGLCMAHGGKPMADGGMAGDPGEAAYPDRAPEGRLDNEGRSHAPQTRGGSEMNPARMPTSEPQVSSTSGSPTLNRNVRASLPLSITDEIMEKRKAQHLGRERDPNISIHLADGGEVGEGEDTYPLPDVDAGHDYRFPVESTADDLGLTSHDADMTDDEQGETLVGQIMKKRRAMRKG